MSRCRLKKTFVQRNLRLATSTGCPAHRERRNATYQGEQSRLWRVDEKSIGGGRGVLLAFPAAPGRNRPFDRSDLQPRERPILFEIDTGAIGLWPSAEAQNEEPVSPAEIPETAGR